MKNLLILAALSLTSTAFANSSELALGSYNLGNCSVSITKSWKENEIEVRVDTSNAQYGKVVIDQNTKKVLSINTCNDIYNSSKNEIQSTVKTVNGTTLYDAKCGGKWSSQEAQVIVEIDDKGVLSGFSLKQAIARVSLPNGSFLPFKKVMNDFSCR
jgi:hypothetical protein